VSDLGVLKVVGQSVLEDSMVQAIKEAKEKIVGLKQTLRAIQQDHVNTVYIADDVEEHILRKITGLCQEKEIPLIKANLTQKELGRLCQIEVGAAIVSIVN
jgi:large subunit ribosomal protein L7A